jgi:hypothetical protein
MSIGGFAPSHGMASAALIECSNKSVKSNHRSRDDWNAIWPRLRPTALCMSAQREHSLSTHTQTPPCFSPMNHFHRDGKGNVCANKVYARGSHRAQSTFLIMGFKNSSFNWSLCTVPRFAFIFIRVCFYILQ